MHPRYSRPPRRLRWILLFIGSLALSLGLGLMPMTGISLRAIAQTPTAPSNLSSPASASDLVRQGVERYRAGDFSGAIAPWQEALNAYEEADNLPNQAIVLENLARVYRSLGDATNALPYWEQATEVYRRLGDGQRLGRMLTEQAQTYTSLGQHRQAVVLLCNAVGGLTEAETATVAENCEANSALGLARSAGDRPGEAAALGSLGEAQRLQGEYDWAIANLMASLAIAREVDNPAYTAAITNGLGSVYAQLARISDRRAADAIDRGDAADAAAQRESAQTNTETALNYFQQSFDAATRSGDSTAQLRALLGMIPAYHYVRAFPETQSSHAQAIALLNQTPLSRDKAYAAIKLTNLLPLTQSLDADRGSLAGTTCLEPEVRPVAETLLTQAIATARQIGDSRAASFALGKLGQIYECERDYRKALAFTEEAEVAADQDLQSRDSLYLWQWQTGRILYEQGEPQAAIAAYEEAIATLEKIRSDILTADRDIQFDFRDAIEPVYRQLAELRLNQAPTSKTVSPDEVDVLANINAALTAIDSLKLAELQNYFGDECIILAAVAPEATDRAVSARYENTGIFSTFIQDDRTAIILTLPDGRQRIERLSVSRETLNQEINEFRLGLETSLYALEDYDPSLAALLYDQLIRPFMADLETSEVEMLVFVQDGIFRSVPMAALYDGEQYLIQHYAIATTPSLSLTTVDPPVRRHNLRALALGLSTSAVVGDQEFAPLRGVDRELDLIREKLPGSQSLLNAEFTLDRLRQELQENEYSIIHMATHGEFGAEPADTFLVTGDGQKLTIGQLESAIRQLGGTDQVDLLMLTACKTAIGDSRSALGLAGVAVQAGARSAIASLWAIGDFPTVQLMERFYQALNDPNLTKAQALQAAQLAALNSSERTLARPGAWAPFILIGDWR
ncbi:MAG: CHAT domain-containing protein [Synechococcales bacterium]|nr:CHAT domain-containing protein [Synechococcales bacterium]